VLISRPTINGEMFGIMTTLQAGRGAQLIPVAAPIAYVPLDGLAMSNSAASPPGIRATRAIAATSGERRGAVRAVPAGIAGRRRRPVHAARGRALT
jgi:hypothetical protein